METKANYVLIGAFTLIVSLALLGFGLWAAKYSSDRTWQEYRVVFREAVTGLSVGSPVQYNGIAVGSITELNLVPDDPRQVVARIRLNSLLTALYVNYAVLIVTALLVYDLAFITVMACMILGVLLLFILILRIALWRFRKSTDHEE